MKLKPPSKLYVITHNQLIPLQEELKQIQAVLDAGAGIIQLRKKNMNTKQFVELTQAVKQLTDSRGIPLIINDRCCVALATDAAGVHLGQEDMPIQLARRLLGPNKTIGISTHNLLEAEEAYNNQADYISIGPIFSSPTKPDLKPLGVSIIGEIKKLFEIPVVAIGGINVENAEEVIRAGAAMVAVISAVFKAKDIYGATRNLAARLG